MGHTIHRYLLLLIGGLLIPACGAPSTNRIHDKDPVKCFWVQTAGGASQVKRLAIVNQEIDVKSDPSGLRKGEVSRLSNDEMEIFIVELEGKGFFDIARSAPPAGSTKYVSLHIPSGDYYVGMNKEEKMALTYAAVVKAFTAYWTYGDTRFMTGSSTGEAPVDFEKQKAEQERKNQERRNKRR